MNNSIIDAEFEDYDFADDYDNEDVELYDYDGLDEDYDDIDEADYDPEFWAEYELDLFDDLTELANALREVVHEDYQQASPEEMEDALFNILDQMTLAESVNFTSALRQVGRSGEKVLKDPTTGKVARTGLPIAGATIGTIYGGPTGTAVGGKLGQAAAQAFPGGKTKSTPPLVSKTTPPTPPAEPTGTAAGIGPGQVPLQAPSVEKKEQPVATGSSMPVQDSPQGGSTAARQVLFVTESPVMKKVLLGLSLGSSGKNSVSIGKEGQTVRSGELMALLAKLAGEAAADADQLVWENDETPAYLLDSEGRFVADPAVPEERAEALYEALLTAENQELISEELRPSWSDFIPFAKGAKLLVEYETWIRNFDIGNASILDRTPDLFKAKIHIDKREKFNIPETFVTLMIEYKQEGPGNKAIVMVNGQQFTDNNVTIRSKKNIREILMSIYLLGQKIERISIHKESINSAKIKFDAGGDQHVLVLTRD